MFQDSIPTALITKAQIHTASVEEKIRRESALLNKDFYYSKQEKSLELVTSDVDPITANFTNVIVKKKTSLLYGRPLVREYDGSSASISFLEKLYQQINIDFFLQKVDLAAELTGTGIVFIVIDETGTTKLYLYDASDFSIVESEENTEQIDAISLVSIITRLTGSEKNPTVERALKTEIWTNSYITRNVNGVKDTQTPNDLGYLPFVAFRGEEVYGQYLGHSPATHIRQLNQTINQQLTNIGYMIKLQAGTPVVLKGFQQGEGITIHPGRAISLPAGAEASVLDFNPKIMDALENIKWTEQKMFELSSVPKVSVVGDDKASSGKELMIKWYPLLQIFKEKSLRFEKYELNLANMILKVNGLEPIEGLKVKYPEEAILPYSPTSDELEKNVKFGIQTPIDELLRIDPTLDEKEAETIIRANLEFNNSIKLGDTNGTEKVFNT
jgi:hypothetical protein